MIGDAVLEALRHELGTETVAEHEPREFEGVKLRATVSPRDGLELAAALAALSRLRVGAIIEGGASRLALGNLPRAAGVVLSTARLAGIEELDPEEGVMRAGAGTRLAELAGAAAEAGWQLPLDPPGSASTLGGALASAALGPRHLALGRPRDAVLGLDFVLGDGTRVRSGGRVVKNVTGYDLARLQVGALGSLGVIEAAWIRLRPAAERAVVVTARVGSAPEAVAAGREAAALPAAQAVALADPSLAPAVEPWEAGATGYLLVAELGGDEPVVEQSARRLRERIGARPASPGALERTRGLMGDTFGPAGLRFRIAALPSRLEAAVRTLERARAALLLHPGTGLVHARFGLDLEVDEAGADAAWRAVQAAARSAGGSFCLEAAPAWAKVERDIFGDPSDVLALLRRLKERFDPAGVLNPGRAQGRL